MQSVVQERDSYKQELESTQSKQFAMNASILKAQEAKFEQEEQLKKELKSKDEEISQLQIIKVSFEKQIKSFKELQESKSQDQEVNSKETQEAL